MNYNIQFEADQIYHVYNRAIGKELLFYQQRNYQYFLDKYFQRMSPHLDTLAYCLLPNHFHLLIRVKENANLEALHNDFRKFFIGYSMAINKQEKRKGSLFMKPYKRKKIEDNDYLSKVITYIHLNPWLHNEKRSFEEYPWSSYRAYLDAGDNRLETTTVLEWYGDVKSLVEAHHAHMNLHEPELIENYFL